MTFSEPEEEQWVIQDDCGFDVDVNVTLVPWKQGQCTKGKLAQQPTSPYKRSMWLKLEPPGLIFLAFLNAADFEFRAEYCMIALDRKLLWSNETMAAN